MTRTLTILGRGAIDVCRSPLLIAGALIVTLAAAAPFALIVGNQLQDALANQPPIALGSGEIDADWWSEFRAHAEGLAATFTPTVLGFAAPLDNLSAVLDGTRRPWPLLAPIVAAMVVWAWFWGVALSGDQHGSSSGAVAALPDGPPVVVHRDLRANDWRWNCRTNGLRHSRRLLHAVWSADCHRESDRGLHANHPGCRSAGDGEHDD